MRGGVVQDQVIKMFYKNIAHITWLQATKNTKGRAFLHRHMQTLLLMNLVSTAPYIKGAQHCSPSCLYHKVTGLRFSQLQFFAQLFKSTHVGEAS